MKKTIYMIVLAMSSLTVFAQGNVQPGQEGEPRGPRLMRMAPPPFDWWRNSEVAQKLNLTDQQKQQLEEAFSQSKVQLGDLRSALEREQLKLKSLMDSDPLQEQQVLAQIDVVQGVRARLERNFALMALTFRKILTSEQWKTLQQQDILKFHRRREGGPPMPPPGGGAPPND